MMRLDRLRLQEFVGPDTAFELEFLRLLLPSVEACATASEAQDIHIYGTLHAAKAGIEIAANDALRQAFAHACDQTANISPTDATAESRQAVSALSEPLRQLADEIKLLISADAASL